MSYKVKEEDIMAYLYGELEGDEKERVEKYLLENPEGRKQLEQFQQLRSMMGTVKDKEVIAPPIFVGDHKQKWLWDAPYFKTIISIAASLLLIIMVAKYSGASITASGNEFKISFGNAKAIQPVEVSQPTKTASLTEQEVQRMINESLNNNNNALSASWEQSQEKLDASIRKNLTANSAKIDKLVREAATASQEQIQQYVSGLQTDNMQMVKDYFKLTSSDQKQYVESLLVDFAKYLQQQRKDDLQVVQTRLNSMEQKTKVFKQETEQIISSIISTVNTAETKETKY
jgi:hypothetical protein